MSYISSISAKNKYDTESVKSSKRGKPFTEIQEAGLKKHYNDFFHLSYKDKLSLATSLGLPLHTVKNWMYKKRKREKLMQETEENYQRSYKQKESINATGI